MFSRSTLHVGTEAQLTKWVKDVVDVNPAPDSLGPYRLRPTHDDSTWRMV